LRHVLEFVKGSGALDKGPLGPVAVNLDEESGGGVAIEVEDVDGVDDGVAEQRRGNVRGWRNGLDRQMNELAYGLIRNEHDVPLCPGQQREKSRAPGKEAWSRG